MQAPTLQAFQIVHQIVHLQSHSMVSVLQLLRWCEIGFKFKTALLPACNKK
jgi:hypothetical protein